MTFRIPSGVAAAVVLIAACESPGRNPAGPGEASSSFGALGEDGDLVVTTVGTRINAYSALAADAPAGSTTLTVTSAGQLNLPAPMGDVGPGDLVLVIQMQGATIDTSNGPSFGAVTDFGSAGRYELAVVSAVNTSASTLDLALGCGGLRNDYFAGQGQGAQVVRVPQLSSLTIEATGSVVPMPWNGARGGVVAAHVVGPTVVDGSIDATAAGFRGGVLDLVSNASGTDNTTYRSLQPTDGAEKGESIAGFQPQYDAAGGRYGRAAAANGGGGGTAHNGGGGGGANASNGSPLSWTGQGVMDPAAIGAAAWALDPAYIANGNALTNSTGGGRGGYTFSANDLDALTVGPGGGGWGGNSRRERGGLGGRPFTDPVNERIYLGGGGGAGDSNNGAGGAGGAGGGIVLLLSASVDGSGVIAANGGNGATSIPAHNDGPGGGGGGGTIVVESPDVAGVSLFTIGGNGGDQLITNDEAEGPGGGGGGGRIAVTAGAPARSALGGFNGTSTSDSVAEFPANGATMGAEGVDSDTLALGGVVGCRPLDVSVTKDDGRDSVRRGGRTIYTIEVSLASDAAGAQGIVVQDPLPAGASDADWTCDATAGSSCTDASGTGPIDTTVNLLPGGVATFVVDLRLERDAGDLLSNTVTVSAPGYADEDPTNDVAVDVNEVLGEYGVAGSGCGCRTANGRVNAGAVLPLLLVAALFARRKRA